MAETKLLLTLLEVADTPQPHRAGAVGLGASEQTARPLLSNCAPRRRAQLPRPHTRRATRDMTPPFNVRTRVHEYAAAISSVRGRDLFLQLFRSASLSPTADATPRRNHSRPNRTPNALADISWTLAAAAIAVAEDHRRAARTTNTTCAVRTTDATKHEHELRRERRRGQDEQRTRDGGRVLVSVMIFFLRRA